MTGQEQPQEPLSLSDLLKKLIEMGGSDLHLTTNTPPQVRVDGHLRPVEGLRPLTSADTKSLAYSVLTDAQKHRFEEALELDFSFGVRGLSRFRANLFNQRGAVGAVFRAIPYEIKSFDDLGLPPVVSSLCDKPRGLILVTGPTGSGKSTTLAAMLDKVNRERHEHIVTIEDPIEFLHAHKYCIVNQREVGADTRHLTFATLHTNSAASTINRIIDVFPSAQQAQIRAQLSLVLEGILCQSLIPRADGRGRAMALEILVPNPAIRNLIREDKVHQIYSMMQTGQGKHGMQTFNQALATLYHKRLITIETAMQRSSNSDELRELIEHGAGINTGNGAPGPQGARTHPSPYAQGRPVGVRPGAR